jgi:hypothetical protein
MLAAYFSWAAAYAHAQETFQLITASVGNLDGASNVDFCLTFNRAPDFFTVDQYDRPADSFQFYVSTDTNKPNLYPARPYASLIRGDEIHVADDIRVRNDSPPDSDPDAHGWGSLRGSVPYKLNGQTLTFSIPSSVLNVSGPFGYTLMLTSYGASTCVYPAVSSVTRPTLQICCSKGAVVVQWPTNACMYSLETKWPSPAPSTWSTLTNGIHIEGSAFVYAISNAPGSQYFRLRKN